MPTVTCLKATESSLVPTPFETAEYEATQSFALSIAFKMAINKAASRIIAVTRRKYKIGIGI